MMMLGSLVIVGARLSKWYSEFLQVGFVGLAIISSALITPSFAIAAKSKEPVVVIVKVKAKDKAQVWSFSIVCRPSFLTLYSAQPRSRTPCRMHSHFLM